HYKDFDKIYGQPTLEKFYPSAINITSNEEINEKKTGQFKLSFNLLLMQISVRLNLTCESPIELTYFSWRLKKFDICYYWCGESENLIEPLDTLKAEWKTIYPLCEFCKNNGKTWHKRAQKSFFQ
ncbi:14620_t:CDS:2, partial [Dentiscutata heterogama]